MKRVLIISPHFPPVNAADMHRVRQSLPYFRQMGWEAVVVAVHEQYLESYTSDPLLLQNIPNETVVIKVKAFKHGFTRKVGLGSLSMRAFWFYRQMGDKLLQKEKFDLVYFSTTAFHLMALGPRWKRKFNIPFIVDIQDPWRNDYYLSKPKNQRPPKFWLAYSINKWLEAKTIPKANGIISVSRGYCTTFLERYSSLNANRCTVIPFGGAVNDFKIVERFVHGSENVSLKNDKVNVVYIGRGGNDMEFAIRAIFKAVADGLLLHERVFSQLHFWFVGTSYAVKGSGKKTIQPIADEYGLTNCVTEITDRLPYFESLWLLTQAGILLVPGSNDVNYTASKIYPYILAARPLVCVFNENSSVVDIVRSTESGIVEVFNELSTVEEVAKKVLKAFLVTVPTIQQPVHYLPEAFQPYTDKSMAQRQVDFFEKILALN